MKRFVFELLEILRPLGLRRLTFVCGALLLQAIAQLVAIASVVPFLTAAADISRFRDSQMGQVLAGLTGGADDQQTLVTVGLGSLAMLCTGNVISMGADWLRGSYAHAVGNQIRSSLVERLLERRYEYFLGLNSSVLLKHLVEDVASFVQSVLVPALDIVARLLLAGLLGLALAILEPVVFVCAVLGVAGYYIVVIVPVRRAASRVSDQVKATTRRLYFEVGQALAGLKPILAFDRQRYFIRRCAEVSSTLAELMPKTLLFSTVPRTGLEILVFGGLITWVLISLTTGSDMVSIMPRVGLTALIAYRLMPSLQVIVGNSLTINAARQAMEEVLALLREQAVHSAGLGPATIDRSRLEWERDIRFENVRFRYSTSNRDTLHDLSFSIAKGEHVAFVGPTGSGKSTLIDLILGLLEPSDGSILVDDKPMLPEMRRAWRGAVGYVPQELFLLDCSAAENIAFGLAPDELDISRVEAVAMQAQADVFIREHGAEAYWGRLGERGARLSGGQRQRIGLARALYGAPSVLVLDEATSALDPGTERKIVEAVAQAGEAMTIITVAHRLTTVRNCDRIYFVKQGRIVAFGTYNELVENDSAFRQFSS